MKKIIAGVLLILLIVGAAPFINGLLLEKTLHKAVNDANSMYADTGMDYSLEIINYNRGFLTTDIEWKVNLGTLKTIYGVEEMIFTDHAKHGYTGVVSTTNFEKNPWFKLFIDEKLQGKNPFTIQTAYSLTGDIQSTFTFDAFSFAIEDKQLEIKEGRFVIATDAELKRFKSTGSWLGVNIGDKVTMGKMALDSDLEMFSTYIWDGYMTFSLDNFMATEEQGQLECENIQGQYQFNVDPAKNILSGEVDFSMDKFILPNKLIDGAKVKLALNNVNTEGYEEFMLVYTQIMSEVMANVGALEDNPQKAKEIVEEQMATVGLKMVAAYEKLLKQGVEFQISDLVVKLPEGDITGDITLRLLKDMTLMQFAPVIGQPDLILDIFHLKSDIRIPAELIGEAPMLLEPSYPGMQTGVFVKDGNYMIHKAESRNGKLFLNEKELTLSR